MNKLLMAITLVVLTLWLCLPSNAAHAQVPLDEPLGPPYLGLYPLGLYDGSNQAPAAHAAEGVLRANSLSALDASGVPSANGRIVVLSIGGTDAAAPFCTASANNPPDGNSVHLTCDGTSFVGHAQYLGYGLVERVEPTRMALINGAYPDQYAANWEHDTTPFITIPPNPLTPPIDGNYTRIRDRVLPVLTPDLTEAQVQVVWLLLWNDAPSVALPAPLADAYLLQARIANIVRLMKTRYPNLSMVFLSSRTYAGYATNALNPEPYAYEAGFAVKWLIKAQIDQQANGGVVQDAVAGDLSYSNGVAPWLAWGPYLWSPGESGRLDGPTWVPADFDPSEPSGGTQLSAQGRSKVTLELLRFFSLSRFTKCWFLAVAGTCN